MRQGVSGGFIWAWQCRQVPTLQQHDQCICWVGVTTWHHWSKQTACSSTHCRWSMKYNEHTPFKIIASALNLTCWSIPVHHHFMSDLYAPSPTHPPGWRTVNADSCLLSVRSWDGLTRRPPPRIWWPACRLREIRCRHLLLLLLLHLQSSVDLLPLGEWRGWSTKGSGNQRTLLKGQSAARSAPEGNWLTGTDRPTDWHAVNRRSPGGLEFASHDNTEGDSTLRQVHNTDIPGALAGRGRGNLCVSVYKMTTVMSALIDWVSLSDHRRALVTKTFE